MPLTRAGPELRREFKAGDETLVSSAYGGGMLSPGTEGITLEERIEQGERTAPAKPLGLIEMAHIPRGSGQGSQKKTRSVREHGPQGREQALLVNTDQGK